MSSLTTLAHYMAGEFENREQAIADPVWFVHLRLWQRPIDLFSQDSITLFAEQASMVNLDQPYRQRLLRLQPDGADIKIQYYAFRDPSIVKTGGKHPHLLQNLTEDQIELLPGCALHVVQNDNSFIGSPATDSRCCFSYQGKTIEVSLGLEARSDLFLSHDKGIDSDTGAALWGALMGAYRYTKLQQF
jgi:hypothetical protein